MTGRPLDPRSMRALAAQAGVSRDTLYARVKRGMSIAEAVALGKTRSGSGAPSSGRLDLPWHIDHEARGAVAERGAMSSLDVAEMLDVTRQHIDQITERALAKLRHSLDPDDFDLGSDGYSTWDAIEAEAVEF